MKTVWILIVLAQNGHFINNVIPTLEFTSQRTCENAIRRFVNDASDKKGTVQMRCVEIEK